MPVCHPRTDAIELIVIPSQTVHELTGRPPHLLHSDHTGADAITNKTTCRSSTTMDAILELAESVAIEHKTPKCHSRRKTIPSNNPDAFCNLVRPILEGKKNMQRGGMCPTLPCQL